MQRTELIFGSARRGHSPISDRQWTIFVQRELSGRFPDGWTLVNASGQWRDTGGRLMREQSHIFILLHGGAPLVNERLEAVRALYMKRFAQESVLRIDSAACVSF
jgi:hypothetical protein